MTFSCAATAKLAASDTLLPSGSESEYPPTILPSARRVIAITDTQAQKPPNKMIFLIVKLLIHFLWVYHA